jgi:aminomethyltransferase
MECILSRTGYTGELGYEIYLNSNNAAVVWNALLSDSKVKPAGLGCRDTLRLEMGYPLYGHELNDETTPVEAGFGRMINLNEKRDFIGKSALLRSKPRKKLAGALIDGKRAAREGAELLANGEKIGVVSSGSYAPSLERAIALTYLKPDFSFENGASVEIFSKKTIFNGCFSDIPFYKNGTKKN